MAGLRRTCPTCKRQFRPRKGTRRLYCESCRPSRTLKAIEPPAAVPDIKGPIEARVLAELSQVGRQETVEALIALSVARDIDSGRVAPAQKPVVGQKLAALVAAALEGTKRAALDRVDDLAQRRAQRAAGA